MTERERKILMGADIDPKTANEIAYASVGSGGGGGGGGGNVVVAHGTVTGTETPNEWHDIELDKTFSELYNAEFSVVCLAIANDIEYFLQLEGKVPAEGNEFVQYGCSFDGVTYAVIITQSLAQFKIINAN